MATTHLTSGTSTTLLRWDAPTLISAAFLERAGPTTLALLSLTEHGRPVLAYYAPDRARQRLVPVPWRGARRARGAKARRLDAEAAAVPLPDDDVYGAHYLVAMPARAGGGVLVCCEHGLYWAPPPGTPAADLKMPHLRLEHGVQVVSAALVPHDDGVSVLLSTAAGGLYRVTAARPRDGWAAGAALKMQRLATRATATGPGGLRSLGDGFVLLASASGDSVLGRVTPDGWTDVHRWPSAAPILDVLPPSTAPGGAAPLLTASGSGATCSLRAIAYEAATTLRHRVALPGLLDVHVMRTQPPTLALVFAQETRLVQLDDAVYARTFQGRVLDAVPLAHGAWTGAVATDAAVCAVGERDATWRAPQPMIAAALSSDGRAVVAMARRVVALHLTAAGWVERAARDADDDVACVGVTAAGFALGLWSACIAHWRNDLSEAWRAALPGVPCAVREMRMDEPTLAVGLVGRVAALRVRDGQRRHMWELGAEAPTSLAVVPLDALGVPHDAVLASCGAWHPARLLYRQHHAWRVSTWGAAALGAAALGVGAAPLCVASVTPHGLDVHDMHDTGRHHMRTTRLGAHQPRAMCAWGRDVAVVTWPTLAERGVPRGTVRVLERVSLAARAVYTLAKNERPHCVNVLPTHQLVVGTGYVADDERTPVSGRILVWDAVGAGAWRPSASLDVPGAVHGVAGVHDVLVAAVDAQVHTYAQHGGVWTLQGRWGCAFLASSLAVVNDTVVVGDAMHSLTVLRVARDGHLTELARDVDPFWTTAVSAYDAERGALIGADIGMNVFVSERVDDAPRAAAWAHVLRRTTEVHVGDMVNRIRPTHPGAVLGTAGGALWHMVDVPPADAPTLQCLQTALAEHLSSPLGVAWDAWRAVTTEARTAPPAGVADAALLRRLADCAPAVAEGIWARAAQLAQLATPPHALDRSAWDRAVSTLP